MASVPPPPPEYSRVMRAVGAVLRAPGLRARVALRELTHVPSARVFYDANQRLRLIVATESMWAETWQETSTTRRACVHTGFLEHGAVVEYDTDDGSMRVVTLNDWPWPLTL